jgi:hypothetical protein
MANKKIRQELSFLNRDTGGLDAYVGEFVYLGCVGRKNENLQQRPI